MAIAYDNGLFQHTTSAPNWSFNYTVGSNSNRVLIVFAHNNQTTGDVFTGVTYNGTSMTRLATTAGNGAFIALYFLVAPTSGTHTLTISGTWSAGWDENAFVMSYDGVDQTNPANSVATNGTAPVTGTVNLSSTNSWAVTFGYEDAVPISNGTGIATVRVPETPTQYRAAGDSGVVASSGNYNQTWSAGSGNIRMLQVGIAPVAPSGPTNVKTWDGVTQSTGIKTYESVAVASVKSVIGIT
jgi:hypothetical protein